jgi:hypothetical protein
LDFAKYNIFLVVSQEKLHNYELEKWWMRRERIIDVVLIV